MASASSFSSLIRGVLSNAADRNNDGSVDRDDALELAREQVAKRLGLSSDDPKLEEAMETATMMVAGAGMMRESTKGTGSFLSQIFGNDDLIRGIVAIGISAAIKSQTGLTIPPKQVNGLIERILDRLKGRRGGEKKSEESSASVQVEEKGAGQ